MYEQYSMELQDFVANVLDAIHQGVYDARQKHFIPDISTEHNRHHVNFDLTVSVEQSSSSKKGKGGTIKIMGVTFGGDGSENTSNTSSYIQKVSFSVPIFYRKASNNQK